ncbi:hypothetical protein OHR68_34930 [Spirillospora sp. NBC_00431]
MTDMFDMIDQSVDDYYRGEITRAAAGSRVYLYAPSVLQTAAEALQAVHDALDEHDIAAQFTRRLGSLAARVLDACVERFARENYEPYLDAPVDPLALLDTAVAFAGDRVDWDLTPLAGPVIAESRAEVAYVTLPPAPGAATEDDARPLVVSLGRPDRAAVDLVYSSGGGPLRDYEPGPWSWHLGHKVPGQLFLGTDTRVVAPEPSHETAGEVAQVIAAVLNGEIDLPR